MNDRSVSVDYTNHRGHRRVRKIQPTGQLTYMSTQWHPDAQWLFTAIDVEDHNIIKHFALSGLSSGTGYAGSIEKLEADAEELECVHLYLNDLGAPTEDDKGEKYSTVGRIKAVVAHAEDVVQACKDREVDLQAQITSLTAQLAATTAPATEPPKDKAKTA